MNKKRPDPYLIDDENPEWTEEMFRQARPAREVLVEDFGEEGARALMEKRIGRPVADDPKQQVTLRLDSEVLEAFRVTGKGWQTRLNAALREWVREHRPVA